MAGVTFWLPMPGVAQALAATGWGLMLLGLGWAAWAGRTLHRAGVALAPGAPPLRLVDDGPYALGRHPMALGGLVALAGWALAAQSLSLGIAVLALALWFDRVQLPREEARLAAHFGGWWRDYAEDVRRWL
ncbi:isoprenylcysteine carboxylmethyltransferase family protein [Ideonella sp. DXS22W]|uniref:Isoprenylcysteine carboxylmethyltransferase family protein n=1 Tax=Pseudaquabacterium inlustre TaxID=2984192 RepID=A0ABU9CCY1_9BURK